MVLRVDSAKVKHELDWAPRLPTYHRGIADLAQHYRRATAA